ncbi:glycosyltransferase family 4 protein [Anoxynatronum buryatiense]|uniref:glycosyltransferase family 4 protein n=1 Tax=Anoxynatronum buryatiense TaxID=489973 RepID=UPI0024B6CA90|nr:glycosyltransferase family 4 protein [Anoxynatronum buryatiense]
MKIAVVTLVDLSLPILRGVKKKIEGQSRALVDLGHEVDIFFFEGYHYCTKDFLTASVKKIRPLSTKYAYQYLLSMLKAKNYDMIYMRYPFSDHALIEFLSSVKKKNNKIKIVMEFPTLPYEEELQNRKATLMKDKFFRGYLKDLVDTAICNSYAEDVFGIKSHLIGNGIDVQELPLKHKRNHIDDEINLVGVANLSFWHGYDRLIEGMRQYKSRKSKASVKFTIVGEGEELSRLRRKVRERHLDDLVIFTGFLTGEDLDKVYETAHIGVGVLGFYRKSLDNGSPLKEREYCARGIPFVYGYDDIDFPAHFPYALRFPNDETPINVESIVEFAQHVHSIHNVNEAMRKFAEENLSWKVKMQDIITTSLR